MLSGGEKAQIRVPRFTAASQGFVEMLPVRVKLPTFPFVAE